MKTRLWAGRLTVPYKLSWFPGGEPHITIDPQDIPSNEVLIDARVRNSNDLLEVLALKNALSFLPGMDVRLLLPYFPGARSDREEIGHELGAELYADLVNGAKFKSVSILDPHSPVVSALLGRPYILSPKPYFEEFVGVLDRSRVCLVCPDAGAEKRTYNLAKWGGYGGIVHGRKHRNVETGGLTGFHCDEIPMDNEERLIVVDDICDGGATFIGLLKEIRKQTKVPVDLWVTHGIFSKGVGILLDAGFSRIGTTDSFIDAETTHPDIHVYPVNHMQEP